MEADSWQANSQEIKVEFTLQICLFIVGTIPELQTKFPVGTGS